MSTNNLNTISTYSLSLGAPSQPTSSSGNPEATAFKNSFAGWKETFILDLAKGSVVVDKKENETRVSSEGIAYGLYFSVQAGDQKTFDKLLNGLENYAKKENGLYAWLLNTRGEILQNHSATDAELYAATALLMAYAKWNNPRYQQIAERLINAIWEKDILEYRGILFIKPSDGKWPLYKDGRLVYNPSYFSPAILKLFASVDTNPNHNWKKVIEDNFNLLNEIINNSEKLGSRGMNPIPDWILLNVFDGKLNLNRYAVTPDQEFDAIRVYMELARDKNDPRSQKAADHILNKMSISPIPQTANIAGYTNELSLALYALLYSASTRSTSIKNSFIETLRKSYQNKFIGSTARDQSDYYFQSLLLHSTAILSETTSLFDAAKIPLPKRAFQQYIPFNIYAQEDGSVFIDNTLIYQYTQNRNNRKPYQRAQASANALKEAYLAGNLRPKYLEQESDSDSGAMVVNYYRGLHEKNLFELGPEDFGKSKSTPLGYGAVSWLYRGIFGVSYPKVDENLTAGIATTLGIKAEKNPLELAWDETYSQIYQNLVESKVLDLKKEAEIKIEEPTTSESIENYLVDFFTLTNAARAKEVAEYSRAFDDVIALKHFVDSFITKNPLTGFPKPNIYNDALFSISSILVDQEGRYGIELVKDLLQEIELQVFCREKFIPTGVCSSDLLTDNSLPIRGLSKSKSYLEAAGKIREMIIQSSIRNPGYKARALREKADLAFRILERGIQVTKNNSMPAPLVNEIVGDYLSALEIYKDPSNLVVANWRKNLLYSEIMEKLTEPENYYGLAKKYANVSYRGDKFELARICISLGKFYLFSHVREERYDELPSYDEVRYQGLKEAETWFKFVLDDPQDIFDDKRLNPYKIETELQLAKVQTQLAFLEMKKGNLPIFDSILKACDQAYRKVKIEINRMGGSDWVNEGVSMNLRNIYFNVLTGTARIKLMIAEKSNQADQIRTLISEANTLLEEALKNRDLIIFGSTKEEVYQSLIWALTQQAKTGIDEKYLVSILEIDSLAENSFGLLDLQVLALAFLLMHCKKTTTNLKQAQDKFTKLLPWNKINQSLKITLNLKDFDPYTITDPLKILMARLSTRIEIPMDLRKAFNEASQ